jgi:hypothetical protein
MAQLIVQPCLTKLTPADPADPSDLANAIAFALIFSARKRVHDSDRFMAKIDGDSDQRALGKTPDTLSWRSRLFRAVGTIRAGPKLQGARISPIDHRAEELRSLASDQRAGPAVGATRRAFSCYV